MEGTVADDLTNQCWIRIRNQIYEGAFVPSGDPAKVLVFIDADVKEAHRSSTPPDPGGKTSRSAIQKFIVLTAQKFDQNAVRTWVLPAGVFVVGSLAG